MESVFGRKSVQSTATMNNGEVIMNRSYFTKSTARRNVDILKDRVIFTKDKYGAKVSR